ncbi:hypothetical protein Fmac_014908 [Flemingia macrophylla]|uniref:Secreted protein n=1 Tax=Flemingia macrophylla TaxID=520843 RepID=A0ABD1MF35_9FABA
MSLDAGGLFDASSLRLFLLLIHIFEAASSVIDALLDCFSFETAEQRGKFVSSCDCSYVPNVLLICLTKTSFRY